MKFIGREKQLEQLNNVIKRTVNKQMMQTVLLYGRRRIGKSELIKHILNNNNVPSIYYECKQVNEGSNVKGIIDIISEIFDLPKLAYNSIEEVLDFIFKKSIDENIILVLDEYPYLRDSVEGMDSILQSLIDKYRYKSKMTFVIMGSYVEIMKRLIEHNNPLFGHMDLVMHLLPMDYFEATGFYPNFNNVDKVKAYIVFGGIPYYNALIDDSLTFEENLLELIVSINARLDNEVSMYLKSEISKMANVNEVFETMARGYSKYSDILSQSHVSSGPTLIDVLDRLIKMELVEKRIPINEKNNKNKTSYHISDGLSAFYYRYIFKYASQRKIMDTKSFYDKYIKEDFETLFVPHRFEEICKQYLIRQNIAGRIDPVLESIGKYYYDLPKENRNGEFDIVSYDELGYIFYEVKFRKNKIASKTIKDEIEQVKKTNLNCYKYVFISRSEVEIDDIDENIEIIMLDELWK